MLLLRNGRAVPLFDCIFIYLKRLVIETDIEHVMFQKKRLKFVREKEKIVRKPYFEKYFRITVAFRLSHKFSTVGQKLVFRIRELTLFYHLVY